MNPKIEHIFVLVLENRSFDHLFAYAGLPGVAAPDAAFEFGSAALDPTPTDPPHEYEDVQLQIAGAPPMSGFAGLSYGKVSMAGFGASGAPVLRKLASQFLLFDNWFAALPGPTWPNRFFFHAASSGGLDNSPSSLTSLEGATLDSLSFDFQHGTIFQQLEAAGRKWRIYHDDLFPQVLAIKHMVDPFRLNTDKFSWLRANGTDYFRQDLHDNYDIDYTFIEPSYGLAQGGFQHGNCQHPLGTLAAGEEFVQYIYQTLSSSPLWQSSLLIVTYDEHGGFFDHVPPPEGVPPGDDARNYDRAQNPMDFEFDRLGVRVPAVAISPWIKPGLGSQVFPGKQFDHTAIISTVRDCFNLPRPLTSRDAATLSIGSACDLAAPRTDIPVVSPLIAAATAGVGPGAATAAPTPASSGGPAFATPRTLSPIESLAVAPSATTLAQPADHSIEGFARIAASVDLAMAQAEGVAMVGVTHPLFARPATAAPAGLPTSASSAAPGGTTGSGVPPPPAAPETPASSAAPVSASEVPARSAASTPNAPSAAPFDATPPGATPPAAASAVPKAPPADSAPTSTAPTISPLPPTRRAHLTDYMRKVAERRNAENKRRG